MLKFYVMLLYCLCFFRQVLNAPIIKASGVQWSEPKGNGKGNLTLIMIPQNNSCSNDTDLLIAVKSDYQVVSQDTQLLNLVINEYINDTLNETKYNEDENQKKRINAASNLKGNQYYRQNQTITSPNDSSCIGTEYHTKEINSQNPDMRGYQANRIDQACKDEKSNNVINELLHSPNKDNIVLLNKSSSTDNDWQHKQAIPSRQIENGNKDFKTSQLINCLLKNNTEGEMTHKNNGKQNNMNVFQITTCAGNENQNKTTNFPIIVESMNQVNNGTGTIGGCKRNNITGSDLFLNPNINRYNEIQISNENQKSPVHQPTVDFDRGRGNKGLNSSKNINLTDFMIYGDLLKFLNSAGEVEQHSEVDAAKVMNNVNFYESEKKNIPLQVKEQINVNTGNENNLTSNKSPTVVNENTINIFKLLNAAQYKETTTSNMNVIPNVFKFLSLSETSHVPEPSHVTPMSTRGLTTLNILKLFNITDQNGVTSSHSTNIKSPSSQLFNDKEMDIFKFLNISEPNIESKLKKMNDGNIIYSTPSVLISNNNPFDEANNMMEKLKQEPPKSERNLRSDTIPGNQLEELIALEEGDFDTKAKLSKVAPSSDEEMLKRQIDLFKLNKIDKSEAEESLTHEKSEYNTSILTTCFVVDFDKFQSETAQERQQGDITQDTSSDIKVTPFIPQGDIGNGSSMVYNTDEATVVSPSATTVSSVSTSVSPTCRTSIIYICDQQNFTETFDQVQPEMLTTIKSQAAMQESPKKITLAPPINCASILNSPQSSSFATTSVDTLQNQDVHFEERVVHPLVESSLFLANNNEMPKGKSIPIILNTSDYMADVFSSNDDGKLARFHGNPSDLTANEDISKDMSQKMGITKNNARKKILSIKKSKETEQGFHPGQVVKMRFAGKHIIVEQMPSYRSEMFNKNCESTPSTEPPSDDMEPDEEENETIVRTKTSKKSKPTTSIQSTCVQLEISGSSLLHVTTQITSNQPDRTSKMKENESNTQSYLTSSTQASTTQNEPKTEAKDTQGTSKTETTVEQSEGSEKIYPQTITETTSKIEKTSKTEGESPMYVTECKTVKVITNSTPVKKQTTCRSLEQESYASMSDIEENNGAVKTTKKITTPKTSISILDKYSSQSSSVAPKLDETDEISSEPYLMTDLITKGTTRKSKTTTKNVQEKETSVVINQPEKKSTKPHYDITISVTEEPHFLTSKQKSFEIDQNCDKNVYVPGESIKEIVIQIIRNTKKPGNKLNSKTCYNYKENNPGAIEVPYRSQSIQQPTVLLKEKIKSSSYEMENSNIEKDKQENINYWYPERHEENQISSIRNNSYPYNRKENMDNDGYDINGNSLDNKDMGKEDNEDLTESNSNTWSDTINNEFIENVDKNKKAVSYATSKLLLQGNNIINGVY